MAQTSGDDKDKNEVGSATDRNARKTGPVIRWDGSKMKSTYANVCNVSSTREEVTLLFGTNQTWHTGQQELTVVLSDRIILNPFAAKRLSMLLNNVMKEYESRFGNLPIETGDRSAEEWGARVRSFHEPSSLSMRVPKCAFIMRPAEASLR